MEFEFGGLGKPLKHVLQRPPGAREQKWVQAKDASTAKHRAVLVRRKGQHTTKEWADDSTDAETCTEKRESPGLIRAISDVCQIGPRYDYVTTEKSLEKAKGNRCAE